jgi:hypothetical protein
MSLVEVEIPFHNVLVVEIFGTLLTLFLFQIILYLVLHLFIHLDLVMARCTEILGYTARGYTMVVHYCILVA